MKLQALVKRFADEAAAQQDADDARISNKHADAYLAVFDELRSYGDLRRISALP